MKTIADFQAVLAAKRTLEIQGDNVTVAAIRHLLGGGSHTTINCHLRTLRGAQRIPVNIAQHLLAESRRYRATVDALLEDGELLVIEEEPHCNIIVNATDSNHDVGAEFLVTVSDSGVGSVGDAMDPVRTAYVQREVTHSSMAACHCLFPKGGKNHD